MVDNTFFFKEIIISDDSRNGKQARYGSNYSCRSNWFLKEKIVHQNKK